MKGPGYWKLNTSHPKNDDYIQLITKSLAEGVYSHQLDQDHSKAADKLAAMTPEELQNFETTLDPQETMEQIHFTMKSRKLTSSNRLNRQRKAKSLEYEMVWN